MISNEELRLLDRIKTLESERIGINELRRYNRDLYGYYLTWIERKENKLLRQYVRKFNRFPDVEARITIMGADIRRNLLSP
jgi:DNA mismatch repair ATPase MutS